MRRLAAAALEAGEHQPLPRRRADPLPVALLLEAEDEDVVEAEPLDRVGGHPLDRAGGGGSSLGLLGSIPASATALR